MCCEWQEHFSHKQIYGNRGGLWEGHACRGGDVQVTFSEDYGPSINHSDTEPRPPPSSRYAHPDMQMKYGKGAQEGVLMALKRGTCLS